MVAKPMFQMFLLILSSLILLSVSEEVALPFPAQPITRPNCSERRGNVTIPFPFGIGATNCFLDEWYEILCNESIPRLKKLDLQVLNISVPLSIYFTDETTITVNYLVVYSSSSCTPRQYVTHEQVTLDSSPFSFSRAENIFVAVGCENVATMKGSIHSFVGCHTDCTGNNTRPYSSCNGFDCCRSMIPDGVEGFSVDFEVGKIMGRDGGDHDNFRFAFLVDSSWFEPNSTDLYA